LIDYKFIIRKQWNRTPFGIPNPGEPFVNDYVSKIAGECFIDVGANAGMYAVRYRHNFKKIYAIEPFPRMARALNAKRLFRLAGNITVLQWAASDRDGDVALFLDGDLGRSAGSAVTIEPDFTYRPASHPELTVNYPNGNWGKDKITVKTKRLDDYPFPFSIELIKIDVEGAEFKVLDGGIDTVGRSRQIIVELHDRERKNQLQELLHNTFRFKTRWLDAGHILGGHW